MNVKVIKLRKQSLKDISKKAASVENNPDYGDYLGGGLFKVEKFDNMFPSINIYEGEYKKPENPKPIVEEKHTIDIPVPNIGIGMEENNGIGRVEKPTTPVRNEEKVPTIAELQQKFDIKNAGSTTRRVFQDAEAKVKAIEIQKQKTKEAITKAEKSLEEKNKKLKEIEQTEKEVLTAIGRVILPQAKKEDDAALEAEELKRKTADAIKAIEADAQKSREKIQQACDEAKRQIEELIQGDAEPPKKVADVSNPFGPMREEQGRTNR